MNQDTESEEGSNKDIEKDNQKIKYMRDKGHSENIHFHATVIYLVMKVKDEISDDS